MEPRFFLSGDGGGHPHIPLPHTSPTGVDPTTSHRPTLQHPISPHIDEDALEWVYFAFSPILRCLPYFLRKTRPRASYDLLEAFSPSLTTDGRPVGREGRPHHIPQSPHSNIPHLTPHRRGCPRRGLFRVFDHPKVFVLLLPKNAS